MLKAHISVFMVKSFRGGGCADNFINKNLRWYEMRALFGLKTLSGVVVLTIALAVVLPGGSAFATTQTVNATGTWRVITAQEITGMSRGGFIGNPSDASTHPELASASTTGWTPNPDAIENAYDIDRGMASIVLDLPKVDFSCSSDVQVVVSALGETTHGFGIFLANQGNDLLIDGNGHPVAIDATLVSSTQYSVNGLIPVSKFSTAFGNKLILSTYVGTTSDPASVDIHDVTASYTYDDMGGTCSSAPAPQIATSCNDSYLNTSTQPLDQDELTYFYTGANATGDTDQSLTDTGYVANPDLDETSDTIRYFEVKISPQNILLGAGTVQLQVSFDFDAVTPDEVFLNGSFDPADGSSPAWKAYIERILNSDQNQTITTYMDSSDLADARIFLGIPTGEKGHQYSSNLSNLHVTVSHLNDISVCGISLTNSISDPDPITPVTTVPVASGVSGAAAGAGIATLPETGSTSFPISVLSFFLIIAGSLMIVSTKRKRSI